MKVFKNLMILSLFVSIVAGCMSFGKTFNSDISWIHKNETSQKDVLLIMGEPQEIGSSGGTPTWTYYYYNYKMIGDDTRKEIKFYWAKNKTVEHYSFSSSAKNDVQKAKSGAVKTSK